jgi:hypothetical protein
VTLYLPSKVAERLLPQLARLPAGVRVVSRAFEIPGNLADKEVKIQAKEDDLERRVFLYTAPLKKMKKPE